MDKRFNVLLENNVAKYLNATPHEICVIQEVIKDSITPYRGYIIKLLNDKNSVIEVHSNDVDGLYIYDNTLKRLGFEHNIEDNSFQKDNYSIKRIFKEDEDLGFNVIEQNGNLTYVDTIHALQNYWELQLGRPFDLEIVLKAL